MTQAEKQALMERSLELIHEHDVEMASNNLDRWAYLNDGNALVTRRGALSGLRVA